MSLYTPPQLADYKLVTGDTRAPLPNTSQLEGEIASTRLLEQRGVHLESDVFAPVINPDDLTSLTVGQYATLQTSVVTPDGVVMVEQQVLNSGGDTPVAVADDSAPAPEVDPSLAYLQALAQAIADAAHAGLLVQDPVTGAFVPAPPPPVNDDQPIGGTQASDAGTTDEAFVQPSGGLSQDQIPPGGCETTTDVVFDQDGNVVSFQDVHNDGNGLQTVL